MSQKTDRMDMTWIMDMAYDGMDNFESEYRSELGISLNQFFL